MNETQIFAQAIEIQNHAERARLVTSLCAGDDTLRERVEKLLAAHDQPETFFEQPIPEGRRSTIDTQSTLDQSPSANFAAAGTVIGPYKLLQTIGEGGMGIVFMAEQTEPVKRRVALKVIKPGMDSRQVIARFEAERQALALMDHPNIARVLEAGTTDRGHPYFVMELVNGLPILEYCDAEKMAPRERLELFVSVCRAVHHAHQKGIIHRDLKPNNILVAEYDGRPVPKVIDFGVAKATGAQLTDSTYFTEFGQVIGTLEYMSPEQARRNQLDVDTRSDIYSLGTVLYALLTGETPFGHERFRKAAWDEMLQIIREEEPERPSIKIGSSASLGQVASRRGVEPKRLSSLVQGDLDWIVMKTLEKDRNRRYGSASELADDVSRHLRELPVIARPPSIFDRMGKFTRRNRAGVLGGAAVVLLATTASVWSVERADFRAEESRARTERLRQVMGEANIAILEAESATIGNEDPWTSAATQCQRIEDLLEQGDVPPQDSADASALLERFEEERIERGIATRIEDVVIRGATRDDLESWQDMEAEMREFFRTHGFDLDSEDPARIGEKIRDDKMSVLWADLLELWIGTRGNMATMGGPVLTAAIMQPWADAIYVADNDPIRTGIRKFIYTPKRNRTMLDDLIVTTDLSTLSARTLAWLGNGFVMVGAIEESDRIFRAALTTYPDDLMLNHDYGYILSHQQRWDESARMYHRCLTIRGDVPGIWENLSTSLRNLGEIKGAEWAEAQATKLPS